LQIYLSLAALGLGLLLLALIGTLVAAVRKRARSSA
jgi:hypothetical protein